MLLQVLLFWNCMCIVQPMSHVDCVHVCCSPFSFKLFFSSQIRPVCEREIPLARGEFQP